ncbi:Arginase/deacetylase [Aspergillus brunneoviolaceus CBS 621.78]|uniref:Arginase/deacetylase n=1 Tax=Aspergillus brunneoviolaceus CBS 621.78 TaxID=1450534 RepID=A0ACD1GBX6_9EURO|nr:Arginase/deacetylase [Aspergillus brunneoviolaceus CBS 621.78]RAH46668.1 Arginase/deacetylase [Aspergillus brunneoviolaceus CBS 621.78]
MSLRGMAVAAWLGLLPLMFSLVVPYELDEFHAQNDFSTPYSGIATFAHLNWTNCFDPAADAIFLCLQSMDHGTNPFRSWASVVDCGDIANTPFDKLEALQQLEASWKLIGSRKSLNSQKADHVRFLLFGGDHTIILPALRALYPTWGKVAILHFDSYLDIWDPKQLSGGLTKYSEVTHGSMLYIAHEEGLLVETGNMHLGSRSMLMEEHYNLDNDARCGFTAIRARQIDQISIDGIVKQVSDTAGDSLVYISIDNDSLDPAFAPATGTIEPGGWTTRELLEILNRLSTANLPIIGADIVEFPPVYNNAAETTALTITQIAYELLQWMVRVPVRVAEKTEL